MCLPPLLVSLCSEYAAHHLLQEQHHHNNDLLTAAAASQPDHILSLQQQLLSGANMHLDMLTYGNISSSEAGDLAGKLQQLLPAQGLVDPGVWPPLGRVYSLSHLAFTDSVAESTAAFPATATASEELPASHTVSVQSMPSKQCGETGAAAAAAEEEEEEEEVVSGSSAGRTRAGPVVVTYLPDNPNPSNTNSAVYYWVQVRRQPTAVCTLLKGIPHATEDMWHNQDHPRSSKLGCGLPVARAC
jgi:hypothetical protein